MSVNEALKALAQLRDDGVLTEEEFSVRKALLLRAAVPAELDEQPAPTRTDGENVLLERSLQLGGQVVSVRVSRRSIALGGKVYPTQNIRSIALVDDAFAIRRRKARMLGTATASIAMPVLTWGSETDWWELGLVGFGVLMVAAAWGVRVTYHLSMNDGRGEARVLSLQDRRLMAQVVSAIQEAIKNEGLRATFKVSKANQGT